MDQVLPERSEGRDHLRGDCANVRKTAITDAKIGVFRGNAEKTSTHARNRQINAQELGVCSEGRDHQRRLRECAEDRDHRQGDCTTPACKTG
jgi:CxxC motif-containing protein (DUF1111 family)